MQKNITKLLNVIMVCMVAGALTCHASPVIDETLIFIHNGAVYSTHINTPQISNEKISLTDEIISNISVSKNGHVLMNPSRVSNNAPSRNTVMQARDWLMVAYLKNDDHQSLSPQGNQIARVDRLDSGKRILRLEEIPDGKVRDLSDSYSYIQAPTWSPDGKKIAYYCGKGGGLSLRVYDLSLNTDIEVAGKSRTITFSGEFREPVVWSPDNSYIFFCAGYVDDRHVPSLPNVYRTCFDGSQPPKLIMAGAICTCISSDGLTLYVSNRDIYSVRVDTEPVQTTLLIPNGNHPQISPSGRFLVYNRLGGGTWCKTLTTNIDFKIGETERASIKQFMWIPLPNKL